MAAVLEEVRAAILMIREHTFDLCREEVGPKIRDIMPVCHSAGGPQPVTTATPQTAVTECMNVMIVMNERMRFSVDWLISQRVDSDLAGRLGMTEYMQ